MSRREMTLSSVVWIGLIITGLISCQVQTCCLTERFSEEPDISWPDRCESSDELIVSSPYRCLDQHKHYVTRTCNENGEWLPSIGDIECPHVIHEENVLSACPPFFRPLYGDLNDTKICVRIAVEGEWENTCQKSGSSLTLGDIDVVTVNRLRDHVIEEDHGTLFWSPAKQIWFKKFTDMENFTGVIDSGFQWTDAGKIGQNIQSTLVRNDDIQNGCVYTNVPLVHLFVVTECNQSNPILCLYDQQQPTMLQLFCPNGYKTTRYSDFQGMCIKIHKFDDEIPRDNLTDEFVSANVPGNIFAIDSSSALYVFQQLSRDANLTEFDRCLFNHHRNNSKTIITEEDWTQHLNMSEIDFVNWSVNITINPTEGDILVAKLNGEWMWHDGPVTCAIAYITNVTLQEPLLTLTMNPANMDLVLTVDNESFLWKANDSQSGLSCFSLTFKSRTVEPVLMINEITNRYKLLTHGAGKYWCHGLQVQTFEKFEAEFQWSLPMKFAMIVRQNRESFDPISEQFRLFLERLINAKRFILTETTLQNSPNDLLFHVTVIAITEDYLSFEENLVGLNAPMLVAYYIQQHLNRIRWKIAKNPHSEFHIVSLKSTEFCLPSSISKLAEFNWPGVRIGQYISSNEFCLLTSTGLPATKRCIGDGLYGGEWLKTNHTIDCIKSSNSSSATLKLHELTLVQMLLIGTSSVIDQMDATISTTNQSTLTSVDVFLVSQIMQEMQYCVTTHPLQRNDVTKMLRTYNRLLLVDDEVVYNTSLLNATNVLLGAIDVILTDFVMSDAVLRDDGILSFQFDDPMLETFIFNPLLTNFTGIVATNRTSKLTVEFVDKFSTIEEIINTPDLIVASYIPAKLLQHFHQNPFIIMSLFGNDILFRAYNPTNVNFSSFQANEYPKAAGAILSIVLPGVDTNYLPEMLPIFIRPNRQINRPTDSACGFWNLFLTVNGWGTHGCSLMGMFGKENVALCECNHLTHLTYLFYGDTPIDLKHFDMLNTITYIGCSLSLCGLCGIYLSAILFRRWSKTLSTKYLLQLSTALTLELLMVLFVTTEEHSRFWIEEGKSPMCIALGAVLHYTVLVTWMWMFVIGYMQYMRYVVVFQKFESKTVFVISSLLGWGVPMLPVAAVLLLDAESYVPSTIDNFSICYPSGFSLYLAVMSPIAVITFVNLIIFLLVIRSLMGVGANETRAIVLSKLRLATFLFFLLGLTWIFSFLSATNAGVVFTYLFCVTATLQGFVLFFYFIVLDPIVRGFWLGLCRFKKIN